jgi:hypothetical protein
MSKTDFEKIETFLSTSGLPFSLSLAQRQKATFLYEFSFIFNPIDFNAWIKFLRSHCPGAYFEVPLTCFADFYFSLHVSGFKI